MVSSISFVANVNPVSKHKPNERKYIEVPKNVVDIVPTGRYQVILNALGTVVQRGVIE